ncbi:MAG: DsbA family protein [Candidatus Dormibacteria bacterium]
MAAPEAVSFHFDPICPWAWVTSRWAARLQELGRLEVEWRLFSLGVANLPSDQELPLGPVGKSAPALEALVLARRVGGNLAVGQLYTEIGRAKFERGEGLESADDLDRLWSQAGLDPSARPSRQRDPSLWTQVVEEHQLAVIRCQAFGVPTLILDGGEGPGIFGPVITEVPDDDEAVELLQDVLRMARRSYVMELKRERLELSPRIRAASTASQGDSTTDR